MKGDEFRLAYRYAAHRPCRRRPTESAIAEHYPSRAINLKELVMARDEDPLRPQSQADERP